jgi:hypothetical protein
LDITAKEDAKLAPANVSSPKNTSSEATRKQELAVVILVTIIAGYAIWKKYGKNFPDKKIKEFFHRI